MDETELTERLKEMYDNALKGEMVAMIHLFGIKYAEELENVNLTNIAKNASGNESYETEIAKGRKLAKYVEIKK